MTIGAGKHRFPSRTPALSPQPPMVVPPRCGVRVGYRQVYAPSRPKGSGGASCFPRFVPDRSVLDGIASSRLRKLRFLRDLDLRSSVIGCRWAAALDGVSLWRGDRNACLSEGESNSRDRPVGLGGGGACAIREPSQRKRRAAQCRLALSVCLSLFTRACHGTRVTNHLLH